MAPFGLGCLGSRCHKEQWHSFLCQARTAIRANTWPCSWLGSCCVLPQLSCAFLGCCPAPRSAAGINLPTSLRSHFISGHPAAVCLPGLTDRGFITFLKFQITVSGLCPSEYPAPLRSKEEISPGFREDRRGKSPS